LFSCGIALHIQKWKRFHGYAQKAGRHDNATPFIMKGRMLQV